MTSIPASSSEHTPIAKEAGRDPVASLRGRKVTKQEGPSTKRLLLCAGVAALGLPLMMVPQPWWEEQRTDGFVCQFFPAPHHESTAVWWTTEPDCTHDGVMPEMSKQVVKNGDMRSYRRIEWVCREEYPDCERWSAPWYAGAAACIVAGVAGAFGSLIAEDYQDKAEIDKLRTLSAQEIMRQRQAEKDE